MKLRSIELEAFRAYSAQQRFEFLAQTGNIANLVVLYAPNGFGKTSFFDAVEWALTGKINRLSANNLVKSAVAGDIQQGVILKNTDSAKVLGRVKLEDENGGTYEAVTKEIGKHNRKTDYLPGTVTVDNSEVFISLAKNEFANTHILSHEKIDAFLLFNTPEERYKTLASLWDSENDTSRYLALTELLKEAEKRRSAKVKELDKVNQEIEQLAVTDLNWISLIPQFNELEIEKKLPEWVSKPTKAQIDRYYEACAATRSYLEQFLGHHQNVKNQVVYLISNHSTFELTNQKLSEVEKRINELRTNNNRFDELDRLRHRQAEIIHQTKNAKNNLMDLNKIKNGLAGYTEKCLKIETFKNRNFLLLKEITDLQSEVGTIKLAMNESLERIKLEEISIGKLFEAERNLDSTIIMYQTCQAQKPKLIKKSRILGRFLSDLTDSLNTLEADRRKLLSIVSSSPQEIVEFLKNGDQSKRLAEQYRDVHQSLVHAKQHFENILKKQSELTQLGEKIDVLVKLGREVVHNSKTSVCPLCNASYDDHTEVLKRIDSQISDILGLDKVQQEIDECKTKIGALEAASHRIVDQYKRNLEFEISTSSEKISSHEGQVLRCERLLRSIHIEIEQCQSQIQKSLSFFESLEFTRKSEDGSLMIDSLKSLLEQELRRKRSDLNNLRSATDGLVQKLSSLDSQINRNRITAEIGEAKVRELSADPAFIDTKTLIENFNLPTEPSDLDSTLSERILSTIKTQDDLKAQLQKVVTDVNVLSELLAGKERTKNQDVLTGLELQTREYASTLRRFNDIAIGVFGSDSFVYNLSSLQAELSRYDRLISKVQDGQQLLYRILDHIAHAGVDLQRLEKHENKQKLEEELKALSTVCEELKLTQDTCQKLIVNKINNAFNVDIINELYQKIDPHPDLKTIKFMPSFSVDMKPQIDVYGAERVGQSMMLPVLYFSSAQLDILSLSIFLARALDDDKESLETIFMDDPIHHLDSINVLSFIDMLRTIISDMNRQVVLSTHNENLYKLLRRKIDPTYYDSTFIELESYGTVKPPLRVEPN